MASFSFNPLTGELDLTGAGSGGGPSLAERYTETFNNTTDWTLASPDYTFTVLAATHSKGTTPIIQLYELSGADYINVDVNVVVSALGDVTILVNAVPDLRFNGLILII